ncbi:histone-lysine N-methyltransferase [Acrasis kona]|uniref:Histone-lysine N-methyltransferase n=1 Tax=Acrasis kona TaxID=1008807 RepID=A0AAW2Z5P5_9EUKA
MSNSKTFSAILVESDSDEEVIEVVQQSTFLSIDLNGMLNEQMELDDCNGAFVNEEIDCSNNQHKDIEHTNNGLNESLATNTSSPEVTDSAEDVNNIMNDENPSENVSNHSEEDQSDDISEDEDSEKSKSVENSDEDDDDDSEKNESENSGDEESSEVECILLRRGNKNVEYLVKWLHYPIEKSSWIPKEDISSNNLIKEFEARRAQYKSRNLLKGIIPKKQFILLGILDERIYESNIVEPYNEYKCKWKDLNVCTWEPAHRVPLQCLQRYQHNKNKTTSI